MHFHFHFIHPPCNKYVSYVNGCELQEQVQDEGAAEVFLCVYFGTNYVHVQLHPFHHPLPLVAVVWDAARGRRGCCLDLDAISLVKGYPQAFGIGGDLFGRGFPSVGWKLCVEVTDTACSSKSFEQSRGGNVGWQYITQ